eukprot:1548835-Prymnesium_polylepis.2
MTLVAFSVSPAGSDGAFAVGGGEAVCQHPVHSCCLLHFPSKVRCLAGGRAVEIRRVVEGVALILDVRCPTAQQTGTVLALLLRMERKQLRLLPPTAQAVERRTIFEATKQQPDNGRGNVSRHILRILEAVTTCSPPVVLVQRGQNEAQACNSAAGQIIADQHVVTKLAGARSAVQQAAREARHCAITTCRIHAWDLNLAPVHAKRTALVSVSAEPSTPLG